DSAFYAPAVSVENDPFTSFAANPPSESVPVLETLESNQPEANNEQPKESRFGQLDFGDGFSFRNN
ncbi:MAG: hypothetical protein FWG21_02730, partial [Oscillospiraceae bacterium]|nr:hypothetical protein [Oscillospiraceae bacterium]